MIIPHRAYREKVKNRLTIVKDLFNDPERSKEIIRRVMKINDKGEINNKFTQFQMLLNVDIPALLQSLDDMTCSRERRDHVAKIDYLPNIE